jgi:hypothetical protein
LNSLFNSNKTWNGRPDQVTGETSFHLRNGGN